MLLRPDDIIDAPDSPLKARIIGKTFLGASTLYRLELPTGSHLEAIFTSHIDHVLDEMVGIRVAADHLVAFAKPGTVAAHDSLSGLRRSSHNH